MVRQVALRGLGFFLLVSLLVLGKPRVAQAQKARLEVRVVQVEAPHFPEVQVKVWVWDAQEKKVPDLSITAFSVLENGQTRPVQRLTWVRPGVQWVIALNPDRGFALRDARGVSRYTYVYFQLRSWLEQVEKGEHRLALVLGETLAVPPTDDPTPILDALAGYTPSRETKPSGLVPLQRAIQLAAQAPPRAGMVQGVLFITAVLDKELLSALPALVQQARSQNVQVMVWLVGNKAQAEAQKTAWEELTEATGGHVTVFSGSEVLPDLKAEMDRRNRLYVLTYLSQARQGGNLPLQVDITYQDAHTVTPPFTFFLHLAPPVPLFVDLPGEIVRTSPSPQTRGTPEALKPTQWRVAITVQFPDGRQRDLKRVTLYVDGEPVAERTSPPWDSLPWDLTPYTQPGSHTLFLEAEDVLGLVGKSPEQVVNIRIALPTPIPVADTTVLTLRETGSRGDIFLLAVLGGLLVTLLAWGTWLEVRHARIRTWFRQQWSAYGTAKPAAPGPLPEGLWLLPLEGQGVAFVVTADEAVLGTAEGVTVPLQDPSVSPRHARLWKDPVTGRYLVADIGSLAGTWVNFAPVSSTGRVLEEGDILHVGRVAFRVFYHPPAQREKEGIQTPLNPSKAE